MAPATVGFHPAAAQEAESAYDWYAARDVFAAHAFREELRHAVDVVARNPLMWPRHGLGIQSGRLREARSRLTTRSTRMRARTTRAG